jgi:tripartite-type tricarboxylate transporter receptor subunit TctC
MHSRRALLFYLAALGSYATALRGQERSWPRRPIRILVPFAPGGNTDGIARIIGQHLSETLGQQVIIENRTGASGALATEAVARSQPDGYTLLLAALPQIAILPAFTKVAYHPVKDLAPISNIGTNPFVLLVKGALPITSVGEFVSYVRERPNKLSYSSSGPGSLTHLSMSLFCHHAGLAMTPIHYRGGAAPLTDVIAGHVDALFGNLSDVVPHVTNPAIRLLGVSSTNRVQQLPDVPTLGESGFSGFKTETWNGLMAPAGTPTEIINQIASQVALAVQDVKVRERLSSFGVSPSGNRPEEFAAMIEADIAFWGEAVRTSNLKEP